MPNSNLIKIISKIIKDRREGLGLTQYELSKKMDVPQSTIARLESGEISASTKTLEKVFKVLNIEINFSDKEIKKVFQVCNYIFDKSKIKLGEEYDITNLKLNKLLYFIYREALSFKINIFENDFRAWKHGPVMPEVYHKYSENKATIIGYDQDTDLFYGDLSRKETDIIDKILNEKLSFSGYQLMQQSHMENAWVNARNKGDNEKITDDEII